VDQGTIKTRKQLVARSSAWVQSKLIKKSVFDVAVTEQRQQYRKRVRDGEIC